MKYLAKCLAEFEREILGKVRTPLVSEKPTSVKRKPAKEAVQAGTVETLAHFSRLARKS